MFNTIKIILLAFTFSSVAVAHYDDDDCDDFRGYGYYPPPVQRVYYQEEIVYVPERVIEYAPPPTPRYYVDPAPNYYRYNQPPQQGYAGRGNPVVNGLGATVGVWFDDDRY